MWRRRWRCVIKPAYSFSFLLSINIFVWQNVLYFLDAPRISRGFLLDKTIRGEALTIPSLLTPNSGPVLPLCAFVDCYSETFAGVLFQYIPTYEYSKSLSSDFLAKIWLPRYACIVRVTYCTRLYLFYLTVVAMSVKISNPATSRHASLLTSALCSSEH